MVATITKGTIKHNFQEWFNGEISDETNNCDRLLKKTIKRSRLHIDKELYNVARYKVHQMIFNKKKKDYFENKLNECIYNQKES